METLELMHSICRHAMANSLEVALGIAWRTERRRKYSNAYLDARVKGMGELKCWLIIRIIYTRRIEETFLRAFYDTRKVH